MASLVAQKSLDHIENCDLPRPQIKHITNSATIYSKVVDHDVTVESSLNPKADTNIGSYNVDSYTYGITTSARSLQDSDLTFR